MKCTFVALTLIAGLATWAAAAVIVDLNGGGDYLTLSEGILAAESGDTVLVAPGVYVGAANRDLSFGGKELVLMSMPRRSDPVVIDAESAGRCLVFENGEGRAAVVAGVVLRHGSASEGGGVQCTAASAPTLVDCEFMECAADRGGGMNCDVGTYPLLVGCVFRENYASAAGGGLRVTGASVEISGGTFKANTSVRGGGVMLRAGSTALVSDTDFVDNAADYSAGLRCEDSWVTVEGSRFHGNAAYSGGGVGSGGVGHVTLRHCVLTENTASFRGAGYACGTLADVEHCTFAGGVSPNGSSVFCGPPQGNMQMSCSIMAFGGGGTVMKCDDGGFPNVERCCVFGNGGSELCGAVSDVLYEDPMFCDFTLLDLTLHADSPCMPANNPWGEQIGALGMGCSSGVAVEPASWSAIKALYMR